MNPPEACKPTRGDATANWSFLCVFCNYLQVVSTNVGCGRVRSCFLLRPVLFQVPPRRCWPWPYQTLFLGLILFLVPSPSYVMLYHVMLAECQLIGMQDGSGRVGRH